MKPLGVLGKMMGITDPEKKTPEQKAATSQKNAARVKADIASDLNEQHNHSGGSWLPFGGGGGGSSSNTADESECYFWAWFVGMRCVPWRCKRGVER